MEIYFLDYRDTKIGYKPSGPRRLEYYYYMEICNLLLFSVYKTKKVFKAPWDDTPQVMSEAVRLIRRTCIKYISVL